MAKKFDVSKWFREKIKAADIGKGDWIVFHGYLLPKDEAWVKRDAKKRGYRLFLEDGGYRFTISDKATRAAEAEERKAEYERREIWNNTPG